MPWVRLEDDIFEQPKVAGLSDPAQLAYIKSICYCSLALTDGFVPLRKAKEIASPKVIAELVPKLWELAEGGFKVHDYLEYNPTRDEVLAAREESYQSKVRAGKARARAATRSGGRFTGTPPAQAPAGHQQTHQQPTSSAPAQPPAADQHVTSPVPDPVPDPIPSPNGEGADKPHRTRRRELTEADVAGLRDDFVGIDVDREAVKYRDWCQARGNPHKDQVAGFRNWLRSEEDYAKTRRHTAGPSPYRADDDSIERFRLSLASPG